MPYLSGAAPLGSFTNYCCGRTFHPQEHACYKEGQHVAIVDLPWQLQSQHAGEHLCCNVAMCSLFASILAHLITSLATSIDVCPCCCVLRHCWEPHNNMAWRRGACAVINMYQCAASSACCATKGCATAVALLWMELCSQGIDTLETGAMYGKSDASAMFCATWPCMHCVALITVHFILIHASHVVLVRPHSWLFA